MKNRMTLLCIAALCGMSAFSPVRAQSTTFNLLYSFSATNNPEFTNSDGANPQAGLLLSGHTLYGTAYVGGSAGNGTVFRINTDNTGFTNLHSFTALDVTTSTNSDGANPIANLILSGNTLYGAAQNGGTGGSGTVFRVNIDGSNFTNLYSFSDSSSGINGDGANPVAGLVLSSNILYGTAQNGGAGGSGTVFRVNTDSSNFTNLYNFTATSGGPDYTNTDGAYPSGTLILSGNTLFGTAQGGGLAGNGTVFRIKTDTLVFTNLYSFTATSISSPSTNNDGAVPLAGLFLSSNTLFGTAYQGGWTGDGAVFRIDTDGSNFTNLYNFTFTSSASPNTNSDGASPVAGVILLGQTLYGTAAYGGAGGSGTVFSLNTDGSDFSNLYSFTAIGSASPYANSDGAYCFAGLISSGNTLYTTAAGGGNAGNGTVVALGLAGLPSLGIAAAGRQVVISWPASALNYALQTATNLTAGGWSNISSGIIASGNQFVFSNTASGKAAYYRLERQ